jgi:organic radical activating enzyme
LTSTLNGEKPKGDKMKTLRLLMTKDCQRACPGCVNKDWQLDKLAVCDSYKGYDEIIITGGEPMLDVVKLMRIVYQIREENPKAKIYVYTSYTERFTRIACVLYNVDGITLTLHDQKDVIHFEKLDAMLYDAMAKDDWEHKSLRLNVFKGIKYIKPWCNWQAKNNIVWIKDCPLPINEVFMRTKDI